MGSMPKTVLTISLTKIPLTSSLMVPILWTLMRKMLGIRLILMTSLTKISEKNRKRNSLMVFKKMMN